MTGRIITTWFLVASLVLCLVYEAWTFVNKYTGDTISSVTLYHSARHSFIPLFFGVLFGHLWWPQETSPLLQEPGIVNPIIPLAIGLVLGHLFWSQVAR